MKIPIDPRAQKLRDLEKERSKAQETDRQRLERIELKLDMILDLLKPPVGG